jgi:hypothetical protein
MMNLPIPSMSSREQHSRVVRRPDISTKRHRFPPGQILSLAYDLGLANSRERLLASAGYQVSTFLDIADAVKACQAQHFDLIVVGHSIPVAQRKAFVKEVRRLCEAPVLAILRPGESPFGDWRWSGRFSARRRNMRAGVVRGMVIKEKGAASSQRLFAGFDLDPRQSARIRGKGFRPL